MKDENQIVVCKDEYESKNGELECPECKYFVGCSSACCGEPCDMFDRK